MRLFLCEKPSQGKEISRFVGASQRGQGINTGQGVAVTWCIGHLVEQMPPEHYVPALKTWSLEHLPVIPDRWDVGVKASVKAQFAVVSKALKQATEVVIATDADREGEVIAREVMQLCGYRGPVKRLWLSAFDDASVRKALGKLIPGEKTLPMYHSGLGRARADWLAGMNYTMALTKAFGQGGRDGVIHCGRVQTPVLALVVRRERAILHFVPKPYWVLKSVFDVKGVQVPMKWVTQHVDNDGHCVDEAHVKAAAAKVRGHVGQITGVEQADGSQAAPLLFSLGSLQREASKAFGMKAQAVLDACQALYEKHKATSYPRTDCEYLPESMLGEAQDVIQVVAHVDASLARFTKGMTFSGKPRVFNDKRITAHHAIIPVANDQVDIAAMTSNEKLIYSMICKRFFAQFMGAYDFLKTAITVSCVGEQFEVTGTTPITLGWRAIYEADAKRVKAKAPDDDGEHDLALPAVMTGDGVRNVSAEAIKTQTKPPKRYTEGTLIAAMESIDKEIDDPRLKKVMQTKEKAGIGTDATRSAIIEGLFKRGYMANEKKFVLPTTKGQALITLMERVLPQMADPVLTALWEHELGKVESGQMTLDVFEGQLGQWLNHQLGKIKAAASNLPVGGRGKVEASPKPELDINCSKCGRRMRLRESNRGPFYGCSGYPICKNTMAIERSVACRCASS